ncbi:MAG: hypothetical protein AB7K71_15560 [Polyangiaceae bacterium]
MNQPSTSPHTCSELRDALLAGREPDWARVHLETCAGCRELWDPPLRDALTDAAKLESLAPDLSALRGALDVELEQEQKGARRLKSLSTPARIALASSVVGLLVALNFRKPRPDLHTLHWLEFSAPLVVALLLVFLGVRGTLRGPHLAQKSSAQAGALIGLSAGLPLLYFLSHNFLGEISFVEAAPGFGRRALTCFSFGVGWSLPLGLMLVFLDRNKLAPQSLILHAGAAGGLSGVLALHIHCPLQNPAHLLVGHLSVLVFVVLMWLALRGGLRRSERTAS